MYLDLSVVLRQSSLIVKRKYKNYLMRKCSGLEPPEYWSPQNYSDPIFYNS